MPNGEFEKKLEEWEKETRLYQEKAQVAQQQLTALGKQLEEIHRVPAWIEAMPPQLGFLKKIFERTWFPMTPARPLALGAAEIAENIHIAEEDLERSNFFARLYSVVPIAVKEGEITTVDEVLALAPDILTADELADVRSTISGMMAAIAGRAELPEMAVEAEALEYPELVAPAPVTRVLSIHQLTVQEIIKAMKAPVVPESAMTKEQWEEFLRLKGYTDEDIDMEQQILAEELIADWKDSNSRLEAYRTGLAEMPSYKLEDLLKEMAVQPGLALMELGMAYFEHVSMPLAGTIYKNFIPDLEAEYQRYKKANPDVSDREALVHAWRAWDSPFEGVAEWVLKYMLMEGLVDPLTYVGWGIATRLTKPIPYIGRLVGTAERGMMTVFELPFDIIKAGWSRVPKTITQRAMIAQHQASQYVERYLTKATGRHLSAMSMPDLTKASERAIKYALNNPQLEDDIALAGREMLKHTPVNEGLVADWSTRLGTTLRAEDITRVTVENIENLFEDMFARKLITPREASGQLLKIFNVGDMSDDALKLAQRILETRAGAIERGAMAFTRAKTPLAAMRTLAGKNFRTHLITEESAAALARKETGAFSTLLHGTDLRLQAIWRNGIDRWVVRPFAESYLTFGMYGPMNVLEDYIRSALGGVIPRRMNIEAWEKLTIGLKVDPELKRYGISEMIGPLAREAPQQNWNNWILQLFALGQKRWADKIYSGLVRIPGAYGMDVRRNFLAGRYLQELAERGGAKFTALTKVGPKSVPPEVTGRLLRREVEHAGYYIKASGKPELAEGFKKDFTRRRIMRNEVNNILKEHSELPNSARDYIMRAYDDDVIFREAGESIERTVGETRNILLDDFIRGPEIATQQYHQLADFLTTLEVKNPQEMASAIQAVYKMSEIYGALPDQIIAQATIRSRGLPLAERRATFDADFDRIYHFLDAAGADIDRVVNKLKLTAVEPARVGAVDWATVRFGKGIAPDVQATIRKTIDDLPFEFKTNIREVVVDPRISTGAEWSALTGRMSFKNVDFARSPSAITHELGHSIFSDAIEHNPALVGEYQRIAGFIPKDATETARGIALRGAHESFADDLLLYSLDPSIFKARYPKRFAFFEESFPKTQRTLPFTEGYKDASTRLFDIMTAKREFATEFRAQNMATRHEIFAGISKKEMTPDFWDSFYLQMQNESRIFNVRMAELDGQLVQAIERMNIAAGAKITPRTPIVVKDRPLAPQDIATLLGVRGDDISRALLDVLTVQNNKEFFVAYVQGMARPGDVGFTKEAIGAVYDQIAYSLRVSPESMSWITSKQLQLDSVRKELHSLYNSKMLPDEEIAAIGRYLDDTANAVEDLMFEAPKPIPKTPKHYTTDEIADFLDADLWRAHPVEGYWIIKDKAGRDHTIAFVGRRKGKDMWQAVKKPGEEIMIRDLPPIKAPPRGLKQEYANFDDLRQSAMDEAHKWYYKEYPDYTNANAFDALMKTIYPYWTYESVDESSQMLTRQGWKCWHQLSIGEEVLSLNPDNLQSEWVPLEHINVYDFDGEALHMRDKEADFIFTKEHNWFVIDAIHRTGYFEDEAKFVKSSELKHRQRVPRGVSHKASGSILSPLEAAVLGWIVTDGQREKQQFTITQTKPEGVDAIFDLLSFYGDVKYRFYPPDYYRFIVPKECQARIDAVYGGLDDLMHIVTHLDQEAAGEMLSTMMLGDGDDYGKFWQNSGPVMEAFQALCIVAGKTANVNSRVHNGFPIQYATVSNVKYRHMANIRPLSYKGKMWCPTVKYGTFLMRRNGRVIWTGNSQRWFWLPRSFVRHPGTFTSFERWQSNSDIGYIHILGTSIDINPFRGTIYGTLTTRLTRRDFPEYYDSLGAASGLIEFNDYLSRFGFYPGAHISIPLAIMGGLEQQMGETMPSIWKTPLNALIAARPESESVKWLSEHIFSDRFREYMTILEVNKRGYNGSHIWTKIKENLPLTEEEQAVWNDARGEAALHGVFFEQFGLFRLRSDEQYKAYEESAKVIEEMTGYTPEQQDWLRRHGYRIWDMVGGLSPTDQAILQELETYKWLGTVTPLLPSRQQLELRRLDLDWDAVTQYSEDTLQQKLGLQRELLTGKLGARDYNSRLQDIYAEQRSYIDKKVEENPLMTLDGRKDYYKKYGIPLPVQHPMRELLNLYFSVELQDKHDEETGELTVDWDSFFAQRQAIEDAIPKELKGEWEAYIARNSTRMEEIRRDVYDKYFRKYYDIWESSLALYPEDEQKLINEFLYLQRTGQQLERQVEIRETISKKTGNQLISSFQSDVSDNRAALRYANPHLDAWLYFWGRTTSFKTPQAEAIYRQICRDAGRVI